MTAIATAEAKLSPRVAALLERMHHNRGRLIFALDATMSREQTWDLASKLTSALFEEVAKIAGLSVQLVWYRGDDECGHSDWFTSPRELIGKMATIRCQAGATQIARVLEHIRIEHAREKIAAAVFVGDAIEEAPESLYAAAEGLGVPVFCFQEGDSMAVYLDARGDLMTSHPAQSVENVLRKIAQISGGAWARFDGSAAAKLGELLRAVAAFAVGGVAALANLHTDGARKLIGQMKR